MDSDNSLKGIRLATGEDIERLLSMCAAFLNATRYGALLPFDRDRLWEFLSVLIADGGAYVAEVECKPVGMIGMKLWIHPFTGQLIAEEIAMWVEPEHRGGSIGPRLLTQAVRWARDRQAEMIRASAPFGKEKLTRLYEHRGFSPVDTTYVKQLT